MEALRAGERLHILHILPYVENMQQKYTFMLHILRQIYAVAGSTELNMRIGGKEGVQADGVPQLK